MEARIETLPEMRVVGFEARCVSVLSPRWQPNAVIGDLWHRFIDHRAAIEGAGKERDLGLCRSLPADAGAPTDEFLYMACTETDAERIPEGMVAVAIPAGRYASFVHRAPISELRLSMRGVKE